MITKKVIETPKVSIAVPTYSLGFEVKGGTLIFIAGCLAFDSEGRVVGKGDIEAQTKQVCENMKAVMEACGGKMDDIVKVTNYLVNHEDLIPATKVRVTYFNKPYPASTAVIVKGLLDKDCLIEIEAIGVIDK
jgi:reactive intermediate/imine deaminase